jgi:(p)ppGpp synthase/HD superfamily hydrolase
MIDLALRLCYEYHKGQKDKAGAPYFLHPISVALKVTTESEKITALLHDTIEDTELTLSDLRLLGFSDEIIEAVGAITKDPNEDYFEYIYRVKNNPIATAVKIADLKHNSDLSRLSEVTDKDRRRAAKYRKALKILVSE